MTIRLSIISLAGMARTLVAVGTSSDADMFFTTAAAAPRSTCTSSPSAGGGAAGAFGAAAFSGSGVLAGAATSAFGAGAGAGSGAVAGAAAWGGFPLPPEDCAFVVGSGGEATKNSFPHGATHEGSSRNFRYIFSNHHPLFP